MPDWKAEVRSRLSRTGLAPEREAEIVEELAQHLEDRYEQSLASGAAEDEARRAALLELNEGDLLAHELRRVERPARRETVAPGSQGNRNMFGDILQDLRYGLRTLRKHPGFTAVAVIALALGIGANTAIFSVVNTVLLQPLPYRDPDRLVMVWEDATKSGYPRDTPAAANYIDWRDQNQVFEGMVALADQSFNLTGMGDPERLEGKRASANLFNILGVEPLLGRGFLPEDDRPGGGRVAVLSHGLWQRRFGADPKVVGRSLELNGQSYEVVGVMPPGFQFLSPEYELWVPIGFTQQEAASRGRHYLQVVARLKPGVSVERAQAEMSTIATRLQQQYPEQNADLGAAVVPLHEQVVGDIKPALLILLGAVGFVLLVACANVANLLLARAAARQKEIALRVALGASRARLIRQFLTESVLLAALGGVLGLLLALWGVNLLKAFIPDSISQVRAITVDAKVLGFTLVVSLLTGLIFGLAPATQASNFNLNETLKEGGRDASAGSKGKRIRSLLVVAEVAVSLVLLVGAGLLINSFLRLRSVAPGFKPDNLLTMGVVLPQPKYPDHTRRTAFYDEMIRRVEAVPGVKSAAIANWIPLIKQGDSTSITIEGRPPAEPGKENMMVTRVVNPHYFQTLGVQLSRGRAFDESQDRADSPGAVIVSETAARRYWPGEEALGKRISVGKPESPDDWLTVVGVAADVKQFQLDAEPRPQMYLSYTQAGFFAPRYLIVSTSVEPLSMASAVRGTVWSIDRDQPVSHVRTMEDVLSESIARQRFSMLLLGIFAGVALLLAAVGLYGVMSYTVAQRTREIGLRMALGAQRGDVLRLVVGQGLKLVLVGVALGLVAAFMLTRVMSSLLFGVSPTDPTTLATISLVLVAVALLASYIPARRATKVDPLIALRYE
ncbi:MAG TPA: ABC transporter permease [Pyrinomonadaceae bacterium]|jgi:putative ABC transport system permease protein|nr:ABC transporter permease [Pyrinomonadaceae bacterium]